MTPKEKAEQLMNKFFNYCSYEWYEGEEGHKENMKQCALIAVDEILKVTEPYLNRHEPDYLELPIERTQGYWQEVKKEIEKL